MHQQNSDRYGKSGALVPKGSGEGLPQAEPDLTEEFCISKTPTDMGIGENAIEMRFAQAFSFDFDEVETSLAGWMASSFGETRIYSRRGQKRFSPDRF